MLSERCRVVGCVEMGGGLVVRYPVARGIPGGGRGGHPSGAMLDVERQCRRAAGRGRCDGHRLRLLLYRKVCCGGLWRCERIGVHCGLLSCHLLHCDLVRCGLVRYELVPCRLLRCGLLRGEVLRHGGWC